MSKKLIILVAEDDADDVFFLKKALKMAEIQDTVQFVKDGQEAMDYLEGAGNYADRNAYPLPWMAILDIKMPRKTGLETLQWMRERREWIDVPVLILSSSSYHEDIERALRGKASHYLTKPPLKEELAGELKKFYQFWRPSASHRSGDAV